MAAFMARRHEGDAAVDFSPQAIAALESHPAFMGVVHQMAATAVEGYRSRWMLNRLLNDRGRFIASLMILDLYFSSPDRGGFTAAALRREAVGGGLCSGGRITTFLASMQLAGFLEAGTAEDKRFKRLIPTEALISPHRARWAAAFDLLATIQPEARGAAEALADPDFLAHCVHVMMAVYRSGERMFARIPEFQTIGERDAGLTMMMSLLTEHSEHGVSVSAFARCFMVSRSHARETLRIAETLGLAEVRDARGHFGPGPRLASVVGRFYCFIFLIYTHAFKLAAERGWAVGASAAAPRPSAMAALATEQLMLPTA